MAQLVEEDRSSMIGDITMRSVQLDSLARRLVQRSYEVITRRLGEQRKPNNLDNKFIHEAYLRAREILATSNLIGAPSQAVEPTLVSNLVMALYMVLIVWVPEREIPAGIIQELKNVVSEVLTELKEED